METEKATKEPMVISFNGDVPEGWTKLESILCTSGWKKGLFIDPNVPDESILLFSLLREQAVIVGEYYYTFVHNFPEGLENRAENYFHRLRKRNMDYIYLNAVNYFSGYEPDITKTDNGSLFYPEINAYVRCGDLSPVKLFELMQKDGCNRVIVFGSVIRSDREQPWEEFHSFEMIAPREYIVERLAELQEERNEILFRTMKKLETNNLYENIFPTV